MQAKLCFSEAHGVQRKGENFSPKIIISNQLLQLLIITSDVNGIKTKLLLLLKYQIAAENGDQKVKKYV